MDGERCPVCDLSEMGKRMDGYRECPECGAILSVENLARLRATRARLIAEAVKPWREGVERTHRACMTLAPKQAIGEMLAALLSESVKTNEETKP